VSREPYGITIFCDDFRVEVAQKITLVGCYSGEMIVFGVAPTILPMIAGVIHFRAPADAEFGKIEVAVFTDYDGKITEILRSEIQKSDGPVSTSDQSGLEKQFAFVFPFKFSPFQIDGPGAIRCRAYLDGVEIKLGSLEIKFSNPSTMANFIAPHP
jgi:hypothetical protein